jgi:arylsulfatase
LARQKQLGLVDENLTLPPRPANVPAWDSLGAEQQNVQELMMAAYAGMVDNIDQNLGRLINKLKSLAAFDDTLILFLSDNGACPFQRTRPATREKMLLPYDPDSYWTYDRGWAHAGNTPFREYKQNQHEGGICTPMIAHWPNGIGKPGTITDQVGHLVDLMPTLLDLAKGEYPKTYQGRELGPLRGRSLRPLFQGDRREPHDYLFFSFRGKNNAIRQGNWKLVNKNNGRFELYDLSRDRNELQDLSQSQPQKYREMQQLMRQVFGELKQPLRSNQKKKPEPGQATQATLAELGAKRSRSQN